MKPDPQWMQRALSLAAKGIYTTHPNPSVGCVIVKDATLIGEGFHIRSGEPHAEVIALQQAQANAKGADVYISLEPCSHQGKTPACCDALIKAGVANVFFAVSDPNPLVSGGGQQALEAAGIHTETGMCADAAQQINKGFFSRMQRKRPYLRIKSAIGIDGHIALGDGNSVWISSQQSRDDVQKWRAQSHALLTTSATVIADNPSLNVRINADVLGIAGKVRQPLRIILDSQLRTPLASKIYHHDDGKTLLVTTRDDPSALADYRALGVEILSIPNAQDSDTRIPLPALLETLAERYHINDIQVEAGSVLCGALIEQGLCDELLLYVVPKLIGPQGKPFVQFTDIMKPMEQPLQFQEKDFTMIGQDIRILVRVDNGNPGV